MLTDAIAVLILQAGVDITVLLNQVEISDIEDRAVFWWTGFCCIVRYELVLLKEFCWLLLDWE